MTGSDLDHMLQVDCIHKHTPALIQRFNVCVCDSESHETCQKHVTGHISSQNQKK